MGTVDKMAVIPCLFDSSFSFCTPRAQVVMHPPVHAEGLNYRELFASVSSLEAAVGILRWNHGNEAEATRLMSLLQALTLAHTGKSESPARQQIEKLVVAAWQDHPQLVTAAVCADCYDPAHFIDQQLSTRSPDAEWVSRVAAGHSKRLQIVAAAGKLTPEQAHSLALVHAELGSPGHPNAARYVANSLIEQKQIPALLAWVSKGLNGSWALRDVADLSSLPRSVVEHAWQHGVSMGYEDPRLTAYLLKQGHRPALRWALWLLDGSARYLDQRRLAPVQDAARRHVAFAGPDGKEMARFYSEHWREIAWDPELQTWRRIGPVAARGR